MKATARVRRAHLLPWTLTALAGFIAFQSPPGCVPQSTVLGTEATSGPTVINQTGVELSDEEIGELLANAEGGNIVVAFLSPIPGPRGPAGPQGPEGPQGPVGPAGPPLTSDPNLPQIGPLVGEVRMWAGSFNAIPKGWVVCDGRELAVSDYPELHQVFGVRWGGTNAGMFHLPDFRNRSPMGATGETPAGSPVTSVGSESVTFGGSATHTLTVEEIPTHHHDISHTHDLTLGVLTAGSGYLAETGLGNPSTHTTGAANPSLSGDTGGGQAHSVLDPYFAITYIVFAGR